MSVRETFQIIASGSFFNLQERDLFLTLWLEEMGFVREGVPTIEFDSSDPDKYILRATWVKE